MGEIKDLFELNDTKRIKEDLMVLACRLKWFDVIMGGVNLKISSH